MTNHDFLYRSPDGRECFIIFIAEKKLVYVGTDIQSNEFSVGLTAEILRELADRIDELSDESTTES